MTHSEMIPAALFCTHHHVELSFISSLKESGLIETSEEEQEIYIPFHQLPQLEKFVRLAEMDINVEGIETISHLLQLLEAQQERIHVLTNRVRYYEELEQLRSL